ncbi:hypothetical protein JTE90_021090 [Oedothorax gibbosus]|uniref:Secreted protein n=1 Tax=Oedothorax gibbosus TaxID=931172 RepID=A0AAV6VR50_9ARAC|nr:hypothetical protein JTE90_021090 [Oedothorax gibbosus]
MTIFSFILLVAFGVLCSATEDEFCNQRRPAHCFTPDLKVGFPDSVEALDKTCPILIPRLKCLLDFKNKCSDSDLPPHFKNLEKVFDLLMEACDKESKFHKELSLHLPCTEEVLMSHRNKCKPMVKEALEKVKIDLNLDFEAENIFSDDEDWAKYMCMSEALHMSCFVASTSVRCGEKTGDYVESVMNRIGLMDVHCPGQTLEEVKAEIEVIQPEMKRRIAAEEINSQN